MDANRVLAQIRETIALRDRPAVQGQRWGRAFSDLATLVERLDAHLSAGGVPPEEWREGPDAELWDTDSAEDNTALEEVEGVGIAAEPNG